MNFHALTAKETGAAVGVGIINALLLSAIMVPATKFGVSPMPQPLGLAFAQTLLGNVPLPVGLLFHIVWVTAWSVVYVVLFRDRLTFLNALWLALFLWVLVLVVFFPVVGWGVFGLGVNPKLLVASLVPHVLFAVFLWGLCRMVFGCWLRPVSGRGTSEA